MIKYYYKSLRTSAMQELKNVKRGTWIYAESPSKGELDALSKKYGLESDLLEDALDENEMPRLEKENGQSCIFVRFTYTNKEGEVDTAPLLFVFGRDVVITVSRVRLPMLDKFLSGRIEFATTQRAKLILQILQQISEQYEARINRTSKQIKKVRSQLRMQDNDLSDQDFISFVTIEDELNEFLGSLLPTNATLRRLLVGRHIPLFEEDQDIVEDLLLNNE